jgi:glycosyltransferase involved in cell wall biosynthesis
VRIAEVLLRPGLGGAETLSRSLGMYWRSFGHIVTTVYVDPDGKRGNRFGRVQGMRREFKDFLPDVVHAHSAIPNVYSRLAAIGHWPVVTVLHSADGDFGDTRLRWSEKALQSVTSAVIAVSAPQQHEYNALVSRNRLPVLIPNGVRDDIRTRSVVRATPSRAVAVGRIARQKRLDVLVRAWRLAGVDEWTLSIAGEGSDVGLNASIASLVGERNDGVTLLGPVGDVPGLLDACDLFVHAADREAHPLAPLEAAAAGVPIIVSRTVAHTLPPGLPASVFDAGDAESLAGALHAVTSAYGPFAEKALSWSADIRDMFSLACCADRHLEVLQQAVARGRPGRSLSLAKRRTRKGRS